jgi:hypothetical protein
MTNILIKLNAFHEHYLLIIEVNFNLTGQLEQPRNQNDSCIC